MKNRKYIRNRGYGGSVRTSDQANVKGMVAHPCDYYEITVDLDV